MNLFIRALSLLLLVIPVAVSAGTLDDYYLSRLAPSAVKKLSALVADAVPAKVDRCQTGVRHAAKRDWDKLQPATRNTLAKVLSRPQLPGEKTFTSVGGHFTIHYTTTQGATDAVVDQTDINPQNGVPDWVDTVAAVFEHVYDVEVTTMGFKAPPVTSYDIYLKNLAPQYVYGFTSDDLGATAVSRPSYIEIDKSFTADLFVHAPGAPPGGFTPVTSLSITAAHEFHHAIQFGYNGYFDFWYAEATATWMEDEVYDSANQLYSYLSDYLPSTRTIALDAGADGGSEYGRWVFNRYLAERYNVSIVKLIWERLATKPAPSNTNVDIPMLPVINEVLADKGSSIAQDFFEFAKKLLLKKWTTHVSDLSLMYAHSLEIDGRAETSVAAPKPALAPFTFVYYQYSPPSSSGGSFRFDFTGKDPQLAVTVFRKNPDLTMDEFPYDAVASAITVPDFPSGSQLFLVLCNNGAAAIPGSDTPTPNPTPVAAPAAAKSSSSGGCFIATAAYGSYLHPKVAELRLFRDRYLMTNSPGRLFVSLYYRLSPPVARVIGEHEWMRAAVRVMLAPVVFAVEHLLGALLLFFVSVSILCYRLVCSLSRRQQTAT